MISEMIKLSTILKQSDEKYLISKQQDKIFVFYCSLLRPAIEYYWAIIVYLLTIVNKDQHYVELASFNEFYDQLQWFIESFYEEKVLDNYESCSLEFIKNGLDKLKKMKILEMKQVSKK